MSNHRYKGGLRIWKYYKGVNTFVETTPEAKRSS